MRQSSYPVYGPGWESAYPLSPPFPETSFGSCALFLGVDAESGKIEKETGVDTAILYDSQGGIVQRQALAREVAILEPKRWGWLIASPFMDAGLTVLAVPAIVVAVVMSPVWIMEQLRGDEDGGPPPPTPTPDVQLERGASTAPAEEPSVLCLPRTRARLARAVA